MKTPLTFQLPPFVSELLLLLFQVLLSCLLMELLILSGHCYHVLAQGMHLPAKASTTAAQACHLCPQAHRKPLSLPQLATCPGDLLVEEQQHTFLFLGR